MDINITPAIKIAFMGGAGYLCGQCARIDPKLMALTFIIAEAAAQIFSYLNEQYNWCFSDGTIHSICAGVSFWSVSSNRIRLTSYPIFTALALGGAYAFFALVFDELKVKAQITIG